MSGVKSNTPAENTRMAHAKAVNEPEEGHESYEEHHSKELRNIEEVHEGEANINKDQEGEKEEVNEAPPTNQVSVQNEPLDPILASLQKMPGFAQLPPEKQFEQYGRELEREDRRLQAEMEERRWQAEREERLRAHEAERELRQQEFELKRIQLTQVLAAPSLSKIKIIIPSWVEGASKMDSFLETCERLLEGAQAPRTSWVAHVLPKLPEKARSIFNRMPKDKANCYDALKKELLDHYTVSPLVYRKNFFTWDKKDNDTFAEYIEDLKDQLDLWIRGSVGEEEPDWPDLLLRYRLDQVLPEEIQVLLLGQHPRNVRECAAYADRHVVNRRVVQKTLSEKEDSSTHAEYIL